MPVCMRASFPCKCFSVRACACVRACAFARKMSMQVRVSCMLHQGLHVCLSASLRAGLCGPVLSVCVSLCAACLPACTHACMSAFPADWVPAAGCVVCARAWACLKFVRACVRACLRLQACVPACCSCTSFRMSVCVCLAEHEPAVRARSGASRDAPGIRDGDQLHDLFHRLRSHSQDSFVRWRRLALAPRP